VFFRSAVNCLWRQALRESERQREQPRRRLNMSFVDSPLRADVAFAWLNALAFDDESAERGR
jgi:hypothetical protein